MNTLSRLLGMLRSPRRTLAAGIARPRSLDLALLIVLIAATCSVGFLLTRVGRLAALDQEVRQLESVGTVVTDHTYGEVREWERYRPLISVAAILVGWPLMWAASAALIQAAGKRTARDVTYAQVFTVLVYASSVFALRAVVAAPVNYMRESLGGATSLAVLVPGLGDATFAARLFGAIDIFALWWVALVAVGLGMLYRTRATSIARWLLGAYATGAAALALTQALRGGV
jgi:hypothetical protein